MSDDILDKLSIDNIFDTFNNIVYDKHASYINSLKKTDQQSLDKHNQELDWEHDQGISDYFVGSLFQSINFNIFASNKEEKLYLDNNWDKVNDHITELIDNFEKETKEIHFKTENQKIFFKWWLEYFQNRLAAGY